MASMSDDGEKTCPLCMEDMDLTDQQLKPCKCGYEICVWCWHHIMEMAEKDDSEGRCPACRTPYDKERIVGMAADCERVVAEVNAERKFKSQRAKPKTSAEARKHLNGVRVIKRNLVYIIGMPSNLADETILDRKEYFGQYGKILKVSISRPANTTTAAQQAANNNTFSVYITYAKEEEAIRCIQAVHNFVLEGKSLRACFGTTKYCHIWLRNMTCTNPDCLYLHDVGSQEDSFTKDEIISAYSRSRVPQSASNNLHHHSGHVLPPPVDDVCNDEAVSGKHVFNNALNVKGSTNISTVGKSTVLPAAASWGSRASNYRPPATSMASFQNPVKQKVDMPNGLSCLPSIVASTKQTSAWHDDAVISSKIPEGRHAVHSNHRSKPLDPVNSASRKDAQTTASRVSSETVLDAARASKTSAWDDDVMMLKIPEGVHAKDSSRSAETFRPGIGRDSVMPSDVSTDNFMDDACRSAWDDDEVTTSQIPEGRYIIHVDGNAGSSETAKLSIDSECSTSVSDMPLKSVMGTPQSSGISVSLPLTPVTEDKVVGITMLGDNTNIEKRVCLEGLDRRSSSSVHELSNGPMVNGKVDNLCLGLASVNLNSQLVAGHSCMDQHQSSVSHHSSTSMNSNLDTRFQQHYPEKDVANLASASLGKTSASSDVHVLMGLSDRDPDFQMHALASSGNVMGDSSLSADDKKHRLSHAINQPSCLDNEHQPFNILNYSSNSFWNNDAGTTCLSVNGDSKTADAEFNRRLSLSRYNGPELFNAKKEGTPTSPRTEKEAKYLGRFDNGFNNSKTTNVDKRESSIIADMLSLDFDPWDDSSSAKSFSKLLGEIDKQDGSSKLSSSWKLQHSNQSRFSFARQEDQSNLFNASVGHTDDTHKFSSSSEDTYGGDFRHGSQISNLDGSIGLLNSISAVSSDTTTGVARGKMLTPPGFSVPSRAPPPGFSSHDRYSSSYESFSENHLLGHTSLRNHYQVPSAGNASDVEFIDPAILAVGKGILPLGVNNPGIGSRYAYPTQFNTSDSDTRFHLLKQQSISSPQDPRISEHFGDRFLPLNDGIISSRLLAQNHRQSPFSQIPHQHPMSSHILGSQWDGWNDPLTRNNMHMAEILRNERFGNNNYFPVNEEPKFHTANPGDLYNRAFGM